jgi:hypothetical protein
MLTRELVELLLLTRDQHSPTNRWRARKWGGTTSEKLPARKWGATTSEELLLPGEKSDLAIGELLLLLSRK